ncbi:MAG: alkaline phosphatase family protein [Gemmatimonadaceae bacterium]
MNLESLLATMHPVSRREFLSRLAIATGAGLVACKDNGTNPDPGGTTTASLDNIIVVTMENRSFDHLLGWLPGADGRQSGLSYRDPGGASRATHHLTSFDGCGMADPNHSAEGGRVQYNNGACDGWLKAPGSDLSAIGYYLAEDLSFMSQAATKWTVLDRYFAPFLGPTFPNRIISQAAQTDRISNTLVASTLPTIWDRLSSAGLSGANYGPSLTTASLWGNKYQSIIKPIATFFADATAGALPNVSFVDPELTTDFSNSYHPPGDIRNAEAFLGSIYKAVTTGPQWKSSLLVITFDEWGGFYDHVPPTLAPLSQIERTAGNTDGLRGFRVPTILVSPFAKRQNVSSKVYDHASILRLIESRWGLQPLALRDASANNLMDEIDLTMPVVGAPAIVVPAGPFGTACV